MPQRTRALKVEVEEWPLAAPFRIAGYTFESMDVLLVTIQQDGSVGRGEAVGVYYRSEKPASMIQQIEQLRPAIESCVTRSALQGLLPPGGARNALDCALWDLEAKLSGRAAWRLAGLPEPQPVITAFTCGADDPGKMAEAAAGYIGAQAIKLKLTGEPIDAQRVRAVRAVRPDVWLGVDANQGFAPDFLRSLMPLLVDMRVALIEQPFPVGEESWLDGLASPIPIAADESVQSLADLDRLVSRFDIVNIKLDKCGGLTEAFAMARQARSLGFTVMVGNMIGTSLAMAPAFLVAQLCSIVDLDGPIFLQRDRNPSVQYGGGFIACAENVWGAGAQAYVAG